MEVVGSAGGLMGGRVLVIVRVVFWGLGCPPEKRIETRVLKMREHCFTDYNTPTFNTTWMGDTHGETNVLPSVTVRGCGLILSVIHLTPLTADSLFTFTVLVIFFADTFRYIVW